MSSAPSFSTETVSLTQVDDGLFCLNDDFTNTAADGTPYTIDKTVLNEKGTDLASVPSILWWYVGSYGRHTRPALLHDFLVRTWPAEQRPKADALFREAFKLCQVPMLRRGLMWTAVSLETTFLRVRSRRSLRVLAVLLNVAVVAGSAMGCAL